MEDDFEINQYLSIIKKHAVLASSVFLLVLAIAAVYTYSVTPIYESTSVIVVEVQDPTSSLLGRTPLKIDLEAQKEIIKSSEVFGRIEREHPDQGLSVTVQGIRNTNILNIRAQASSPELSQQAANQAALLYINYTVQDKKTQILQANEFIDQQVVAFENELKQLSREIDDLKDKNLTFSEQLDLRELEKEFTAKDRVYSTLLQKRTENEIFALYEAGYATILDEARLPLSPLRPNRPLYLALGLLLAAMISVGTVYFKQVLSDTANEKDAESIGQIVGSLPKMRSQAELFSQEPGSFREHMMSLMTNLDFQVRDTASKVVCFTSPQTGDGKSLIVANLGIALAHSKKKVLLVDLNLRRPRLHRAFGCQNRGVIDAIEENRRLPEYVQKTPYDNLYIIAAGKLKQSPHDALISDRMKSVFDKFKSSAFDIVLFDTPSLQHAESLICCSHADATVVIVSADSTKSELVKNAKHRISKSGVKVLGTVLNRV